MRCFIAIEVAEPIKGGIGQSIETLKQCQGDVKWVVSKNIHLTLKFLGNTPEELLPRIGEFLSKIVGSYEPFSIKIYNIGVFPNMKHPRVIWVGIEDSEILNSLQKDINDSMALLGYEREEREFNPHLTLGRVRSQKGITNLVKELSRYQGKDFGSMKVENIKLMHSELRPTGAEYYCLHEIPLRRRKNGE